MFRKLSTDRILGLTAMTVSLMTLIIFIYQTDLLRQQNHISVLPYLAISSTTNSANNTFEINVINHGVGPAIIESAEIIFEGSVYNFEDYEDNMMDVLRAIDVRTDSLRNYSTSVLNPGIAIPLNEQRQVFGIIQSPDDFRLVTSMMQDLLGRGLDYRIVYRSLLDDRWEISGSIDGPIKLD